MLNFSCIRSPHWDSGTSLFQMMHMVEGFAELEPQPPASTCRAAKNPCAPRLQQPRGSHSSWMSGPGSPLSLRTLPTQGFLSHPGRLFAVFLSAEPLARPNAKCCLAASHPFLGPYPPCRWISDPPSSKGKWQLAATDGWGLPLHLSTDKCFNLSMLRNHVDWRDFLLCLGSVD